MQNIQSATKEEFDLVITANDAEIVETKRKTKTSHVTSVRVNGRWAVKRIITALGTVYMKDTNHNYWK